MIGCKADVSHIISILANEVDTRRVGNASHFLSMVIYVTEVQGVSPRIGRNMHHSITLRLARTSTQSDHSTEMRAAYEVNDAVTDAAHERSMNHD